jgi:hypothetical protein
MLEFSGDDQETGIVAPHESENEDINSAQVLDDPDRYLRRSQGSPEPSGTALETPGRPDEAVAGERPPGRPDNLEQFQLDEVVRLSAEPGETLPGHLDEAAMGETLPDEAAMGETLPRGAGECIP